jgi:hypothetical protein
MRIGVDFGGVLTATTAPPEHDYLSVPPREGSFAAISRWKSAGDVPVLITMASAEHEPKAREWLSHWRVDDLFDGRVEFCGEMEGKIDICRQNGVEVMIDDTISQLQLLGGVVLRRILFNSSEAPEGMIPAPDWQSAAKIVDKIKTRGPQPGHFGLKTAWLNLMA